MSYLPIRGSVGYYLLWAFWGIVLSAIMLICYDLVMFVLSDLKRYNVLADNYIKYDCESDEKYELLINDFKTILVLLFLGVWAISFANSLYQEDYQSEICLNVSAVAVSSFIVFLTKKIMCMGKDEWKKICVGIGKIMDRVVPYTVSFLFALFLILIPSTNKSASVDVLFDNNGKITIENAIDEQFGGASIRIFDEKDCLIKNITITPKDVLCAK